MALPAAAEDKKPDGEAMPPGLKVYQGRRVAHTMHWMGANWLVRKEREREESVQEMIKELRIKPGMTIADLGCGNGYHSLMMMELTGKDGVVYGVDIQKEMLTLFKKRAAEAKLDNYKLVLGTLIDPKLPAGKFDLILIVDAYHEFSHPVHMLAGIRKALKPDGKVVLLEFRAEDDTVPIKPDHKMTKAQVNKELVANGFKLVREYDDLPWQHMMFFSPDADYKKAKQ
jgi:ubiquinone/menaquinone biosynthesis C-methylase UbiE